MLKYEASLVLECSIKYVSEASELYKDETFALRVSHPNNFSQLLELTVLQQFMSKISVVRKAIILNTDK